MAQLADIQSTQNMLEESFSKRMMELEAQLQVGGSAKDTVARVAEEFRTFRELMLSMLRLLRQQIAECARIIDVMETRHRRKALLFVGVKECAQEDCITAVLSILNTTLAHKNMTAADITACHRLGSPTGDHHRPILVKFANTKLRSSIWNAKSRLKGGSISVKEFLTRPRQLIFITARQHFGMRSCWTQDGVINIKLADGSRAKLTTTNELDVLIGKFPKIASTFPSVSGSGTGTTARSRSNHKSRKP